MIKIVIQCEEGYGWLPSLFLGERNVYRGEYQPNLELAIKCCKKQLEKLQCAI